MLYIGIFLLCHFDVKMTSYENFVVDFGRIQKYPCTKFEQDQAIILPHMQVSSLFIPRHIHNKRLPWQHLRLMKIVIMCKMTPICVRLNLKNFILIFCGVTELLRKVSNGEAESASLLGETGLKSYPFWPF